MTTSSPSHRLLALGVAVAAALSVGACSQPSDRALDAVSGATPSPVGDPAATTPPEATPSAPAAPQAPRGTPVVAGSPGPAPAGTPKAKPAPAPAGRSSARDWDGARFDIGTLERVDRTEAGQTLLVFDRKQTVDMDQRMSGKDFTEEPFLYGNTDQPLINDTTKLRTYVAQAGLEVLLLANLDETCDFEDPAEARWAPVSLDRVIGERLWKDFQQVTLTFTSSGSVSRLRLATGC